MRVAAGIFWFFVLYYGAMAGAGRVAAELELRNAPDNTTWARLAGLRWARENHAYIMAATGIITIAAASKGVLPGTRQV